ncbi:PadR family transcriptional regulator [Herbaspirillum sp. RV1423]|uniref:PadR family transcriptional regulator n=1 Tax=Herbaspirillum sp. RV1423 TaxID=1443993 RepID=UPI0004B6FF31|nr:PadR family transcriptional regulator [Herbaspirillum sp. RV1423]
MFGRFIGGHHGPTHHRHERPHHGGGLFEERGRGREGGRGPRMFEQGSLRLVILHLLRGKPRHGYEVIKAIEQLVGGDYSPSPGVIYPTLTLLEELGYAAVEAESGGKKLYCVTEAGVAFLDENKEALDIILKRLEIHQRSSGTEKPELRRAVQNFKMALHTRLGKGELDREQLHAIIDIIDRAAVAIERT